MPDNLNLFINKLTFARLKSQLTLGVAENVAWIELRLSRFITKTLLTEQAAAGQASTRLAAAVGVSRPRETFAEGTTSC